jgi:hypothetical protein
MLAPLATVAASRASRFAVERRAGLAGLILAPLATVAVSRASWPIAPPATIPAQRRHVEGARHVST